MQADIERIAAGAPGPAIIFLEPLPCDPNTGRQWCEDDVWDEGGVAYVRSDLAGEAHLRSTSPARAATWEAACDEIFGSPAGEVGEPVARAHVSLEDDGLYAELEVLNGSRMQPEHSPVDLYLAASDTEAMRLLRELSAALGVSIAEADPEIVRGQLEQNKAALDSFLAKGGAS